MAALSFARAGAGPALVMVHGYLGGSAVWAEQMAQFAATHDVICPDLAGFGNSATLAAPDSIAGHADRVLALLESLGINRFDLLGHSMGGMIVQDMARQAPQCIRRLVLYGTGPVGVLPGRFETIAQSRARLLADGVAATADRIAATWFLHGQAAPSYALCRSLGHRASLQAALASLTAWENWDGRSALATLHCPTLVIWGSHDRSYGWAQPQALWQGITGADLAVVPGAAHAVHQEKPQLFNMLLADFLHATPQPPA